MQRLLTRSLPDPAEVENRSVFEQVLASPFALPVRLFWNALRDFQGWWPVLIPALLIMGIRTYRRERGQYKQELAVREMQRMLDAE
ncbi:MAG: hypothetical protein H7Z42_03780 [Roseiflexaceae bacterium]|nr:hypothetical protein [Roseiflexaceae bacterium]